MGLLVPEDREYSEDRRQVGFNRYKQLLSRHIGEWMTVNAVTLLGALPLAAAIFLAVSSRSILVLIPGSLVGGMLFGPFLSGLYDCILRRMRDDGMPWKQNYAKSWKQNALGSLIPGAVLGLLTGMFCFMGALFWWAAVPPTAGTIVIYLTSMVITISTVCLFWPQLVLFRQSSIIRLRNCLLFSIQHFWQVLLTSVLLIAYFGVMLLFAPWTLLLLPVLGLWYPVFFSLHRLYDRLDAAFAIEEQFAQARI